VLLSGYGLVQVAWSYVFASILTASLALIVLRKASEASFWSPDFSKLRAIIKESVPFMFFGLFFLIYFKIDFIMLAAYKSETEVGTYAAAFRLIESLMFIPAAFMGAVFPGLSRLSIRGNNSVLDAANKTLRYMMMLGLPIGFGIAILAERIVFSLFGSAYANSVVPLQIIVWALVLIFINCICPVGLNSVNRQRLSVVVVGVGIIFNISLNLMLIPPFGAIGTSIATVATELFTTILFIYFFHRYIGELKLFTTFYRPLAAALVMSAALLVFSFLPLGALIPLGALVYLSALLLLGALGRGDYDLVLSLAQPRTARLRG
jgi:O-antigen/teichoic acid export membrane protein